MKAFVLENLPVVLRCILRFTDTVLSSRKLRLQKVITPKLQNKPLQSVNDKIVQILGLGFLNYQLSAKQLNSIMFHYHASRGKIDKRAMIMTQD